QSNQVPAAACIEHRDKQRCVAVLVGLVDVRPRIQKNSRGCGSPFLASQMQRGHAHPVPKIGVIAGSEALSDLPRIVRYGCVMQRLASFAVKRGHGGISYWWPRFELR